MISGLGAVVRAELYKSLRKRRTYLLSGLLWLVLPAILLFLGWLLETRLAGSFVDESDLVADIVQQLASPYGVARAVLVAPALLSPTFYIIAIALLAALLVGEERSHRMWKTVLTVQHNRPAVLTGKLIVAMLLLAGLMAGGLLSGALFGSIGTLFLDTDFQGPWGRLSVLYLLQWAFAAAAVVFAFLLVFMVRNVALGIVLVFFLPALVEGLYSIFRATLGIQPLTRLNALVQALELRGTIEAIPRYFFTSNLYAPARMPLSELTALFVGEQVDSDLGQLASLLRPDLTLTHSGLVMLGYGLLFLALLVWLFLRRDVE